MTPILFIDRDGTLIEEPEDFQIDAYEKVRFVAGAMNDGRNVTYRHDGDRWTLVHESERNGATYFPLGFDAANKRVYMAKGEQGKPETFGGDELTSPPTQGVVPPAVDPAIH